MTLREYPVSGGRSCVCGEPFEFATELLSKSPRSPKDGDHFVCAGCRLVYVFRGEAIEHVPESVWHAYSDEHRQAIEDAQGMAAGLDVLARMAGIRGKKCP